MYQQVVRNSEGEPMYVENVMDAQEEYDAYCEEMQMRADDPYYAACREDEEWFAKAKICFEEQGIEVPYSVIEILKNEMRRKAAMIEREKAMSKVQPILDFFNRMMPDAKWYANYYGATPDEVAHIEMDYTYAPYKEDYLHALEVWYETHENDDAPFPEDYLVCSTRYMKEKENITNK